MLHIRHCMIAAVSVPHQITRKSTEVLQDFGFEKEIRKCSTLVCCDCGASVFFRHGKQRAECFVHRHKEACRYGDYCRKQSEIFKCAQKELYAHLRRIAENHAFEFEEDAMIIPEHYTAFVLRSPVVSYAIDIIDCATTTATLDKRRNMYLQAGYQYLQITVDKDAEQEPFSERTMAYLPVKFALNESRNHAALIIDNVQKTWSMYLLDITDMSIETDLIPYELQDDTFAMSVSLDELDIDESGFYTASSKNAFIDFCKARKQAYDEWNDEQKRIAEQRRIYLENERKRIERQRLERECISEEMRIKRQQAEEAKRKAAEVAKQQRALNEQKEILQLHQRKGGYIGAKIKGAFQVYTLSQIVSDRPARNWLKPYSIQEFEACIREMQEYKYTGARKLFAKMCFIESEETAILLNLFHNLKESNSEIVCDLEFLMRAAGITLE